MANKVLDWVWAHSQSRHAARLVLLSLADSMKEPGGWTWPSVPALMARAGLGERAVRAAIAELVRLGEIEIQYNAGPHGCNRYRVRTAPAESAPLQNLHPAESAPLQNMQGAGKSQAGAQDPAESAPLQNLHPAESAPGTLRDLKNSSTKSSSRGGTGETGPLFAGEEPPPRKRARRRVKAENDSDFARWYAAYPVHKARGEAEKAWEQTGSFRPPIDVLMAATERYCRDDRVTRGWGKNPATWLRGKCWDDEPSMPQQQSPNSRARTAQSTTDQRVAQAQALKAELRGLS